MALMAPRTSDDPAFSYKGSSSAWSAVGTSIVSSVALTDKVRSPAAQEGLRPTYVRGAGLTPRLFKALVRPGGSAIKALPAAYVSTISQHVQSVAPSKQVMAQYWCPIVVKDEAGTWFVLHVDPIEVRQFRRVIAEELQHVQEKRKRMLRRIRDIRQELPQAHARDVAARIRREIADAREQAKQPLVHPIPRSTGTVHVFIEATPSMVQFGSVCQNLAVELPAALAAAGVRQVSFSVIGGGCNSSRAENLPMLPPLDCNDAGAMQAACEWLRSLPEAVAPLTAREEGAAPQKGGKRRRGKRRSTAGSRVLSALRWATTSDALSERSTVVLFIASSTPSDLEASIALIRRSSVVLQVIGVFGASPEDPEPALQGLADAAEPGSFLQLFFGPAYWREFVAVRERQLQRVEEEIASANSAVGVAGSRCGENAGTEIVSPKVFEMRLIERIMRECYAEEQQCEEELTCASRVLDRTLVDREDILSVLRGGFGGGFANGASMPEADSNMRKASVSAPATAR
mmetsp:Transcript_53946/g.94603  ORF Transcript_53946/g.94603 Transcript_53946/m.94603 type:complete len:516 (+) Transcript_53946:116-1663(+)